MPEGNKLTESFDVNYFNGEGAILFFKDLKKPAQCAVAAFALLLLLVMVRTISLHQIDALIFPDILGVGVGINWIIELVCNLAIASSAWVYFKSYKPTQLQA